MTTTPPKVLGSNARETTEEIGQTAPEIKADPLPGPYKTRATIIAAGLDKPQVLKSLKGPALAKALDDALASLSLKEAA